MEPKKKFCGCCNERDRRKRVTLLWMSEGCGGFAKQPQFLLLYDKEQEGKTRVSTQTEFVMYGLLLIESPVDMEYMHY